LGCRPRSRARQGSSPALRASRLLLRTIMIGHGFRPYDQEWWHFTLADEPWPDRYFDFPLTAGLRGLGPGAH
jgi:zinc D-Ala-D-Ala dipeptidase